MTNRKLILLALAAVTVTGPALAADLAVRTPVYTKAPYLAPVTDWTGFYFGANFGYGVSTGRTTDSSTAGAGIGGLAPAGTPIYGGAQQFEAGSHGINGGGQFGYNVQVSPFWVTGLEADFQGADQKHTQNCVQACNTPLPINAAAIFVPSTFTTNSYSQNLDWFGTVRGRLGYTTGPALFYVTGGFAYGDVERSGAVAGTTPINNFAGAFNTSSVKTGWTVGGGIEAKLGGGWSAKAEYLYIDLGSVTDTYNTVFGPGSGARTGQVAATRSITSNINENVFRVGLNYKFDSFGRF